MANIIAIDGTAGSGKGAISNSLAQKLNYYHLDSGAIYRTIACHAINCSADILNEAEIENTLKNINIDIAFKNKKQINYLNNKPVGKSIRTIKMGRAASIISTYKKVRNLATKIQRDISKNYNLIVDGRDIGTAVFPNAKYKIFLDAEPKIRAKRRMLQNNIPESEFDNVLQNILERDTRDKTRKHSPLKQAADAYFIDTSNLNIEQVTNLILEYMKKVQ